MQYEILLSPITDPNTLAECLRRPNDMAAHHIYKGKEFCFSFCFTSGDIREEMAALNSWYVLFFHTPERVWKEGEVPYEERSEEEMLEITKGVRKTGLNWLKGRKAQRKLYNLFVEHFTRRDNDNPQKAAKEQMETLNRLLMQKEQAQLNLFADKPVNAYYSDDKPLPWSLFGAATFYPWNIDATYASAHFAYQQFQKDNDELKFMKAISADFYVSLFHAILDRVHSAQFRKVLCESYKGAHGNPSCLFYEILEQLYRYHIERGGNKPEPVILINTAMLKTFGIEDKKEFRAAMEDIAGLLKDIIIIDDVTDEPAYNPNNAPAVIRFYLAGLPEIATSIQLKKGKQEQQLT